MEVIKTNTNKKGGRLIKAILMAASVPAFIMICVMRHGAIFPMAFILALIHVIILGLPIYFVLKKYSSTTWYYCGLAGLFAGSALPLFVITASFLQEGSLNLMGLNELISMGALGAIGGVSGWFGLTHDWPFKKKT